MSSDRFFQKKITQYYATSQPKLLNLDKIFVQLQNRKEKLKQINLKLENMVIDDPFNLNIKFYSQFSDI